MKTALVKTDICDNDVFFEMNIDTKLVYMLVLLAPERGVTRIFKLGHRILAYRSGLTVKQVEVCAQQLSTLGLVHFHDNYVYLADKSSFVQPAAGKLTPLLLEKEQKALPKEVIEHFEEIAQERLRSGTGAAPEYVYVNVDVTSNSNSNSNSKPTSSSDTLIINTFEELKTIFKQPKPKLATYEKALKDAINKDGFTKEEILKAARCLAASPYHQGENEQKTVYANVSFLLGHSRIENMRRLSKWSEMPEPKKKIDYGF